MDVGSAEHGRGLAMDVGSAGRGHGWARDVGSAGRGRGLEVKMRPGLATTSGWVVLAC